MDDPVPCLGLVIVLSGRHCKPRCKIPAVPVVSIAAMSAAMVVPATASAASVPAGHASAHPEAPSFNIAAAKHVRAAAAFYTVRPGDSLSSIAQRLFGSSAKWPWFYAANKRVVGSDPNLIIPGQKLSETQASRPAYGSQPSFGGGAPVVAAATSDSAPVQEAAPAVSYSGGIPGGSFGQCVVARESGGNAQVMNATGHYGLYQFAYGTWVAYGGSGADFGHASPAEQNQVFANALAAGGQSNWSLYDGC